MVFVPRIKIYGYHRLSFHYCIRYLICIHLIQTLVFSVGRTTLKKLFDKFQNVPGQHLSFLLSIYKKATSKFDIFEIRVHLLLRQTVCFCLLKNDIVAAWKEERSTSPFVWLWHLPKKVCGAMISWHTWHLVLGSSSLGWRSLVHFRKHLYSEMKSIIDCITFNANHTRICVAYSSVAHYSHVASIQNKSFIWIMSFWKSACKVSGSSSVS